MSKLTKTNAPKATGKLDDTIEVVNAATAADVIAEAIQNPSKATPEDRAVAAESAASKLASFKLSPLALSFLDKALVNVSENTGRGIEDEVARESVATIAGIIEASGHSLFKAIEFVVEALPDEATTFVYKLCYSTQKALNFIGNMAYRQALDPKAEFDLEKFIDRREEHVAPPVGLGSDVNELSFDEDGQRKFNVAGGEIVLTDYEQILDALDECHIYLQITAEAFGWDAERPMPYMAVLDPMTGAFEHIYNCEACLDRMQIQFNENRAKRQAKQLDGLRKINAVAIAALKAAAKK